MKIWLVLGLVIVAVAAGIFVYTQNKKLSALIPSSTTLASDPAGVKQTKDAFSKYPKLTKRAFIQQQFQGTLKTMTGTSWTLEAEGQTITITSDAAANIRYSKLPKNATSSAQSAIPVEIKPGELKVGETVVVGRNIDWQTGTSSSVSIIVLSSK